MPTDKLDATRAGAKRVLRLGERAALMFELVCSKHGVYCALGGAASDMGSVSVYVDRWLADLVAAWVRREAEVFGGKVERLPDAIDRVLTVLPGTAIEAAWLLDDKSVERVFDAVPKEASE